MLESIYQQTMSHGFIVEYLGSLRLNSKSVLNEKHDSKHEEEDILKLANVQLNFFCPRTHILSFPVPSVTQLNVSHNSTLLFHIRVFSHDLSHRGAFRLPSRW